MTFDKNLSSLFEMDETENELDELKETLADHEEQIDDLPQTYKRTTPQAQETIDLILETAEDPEFDGEMDHIAKEAESSYNDYKDLSLGVETKNAAEIGAVGERYLATALEARKLKMKRKHDVIDLMIKHKRVQLAERKQDQQDTPEWDTEGETIDRNEYLK